MKIATLLNNVTMYKLVIYCLIGLLLLAIGLNVLGISHFAASGILISLGILVLITGIAQWAFYTLFSIQTNNESWFITALILVFIFPPVTSLYSAALLAGVGLLAIASKFLFTYRGRLLFNPVAFAAVCVGVTGLDPAIWWVGSPFMLIGTTLIGILIILKLRRYILGLSYLLASIITAVVVMHQPITSTLGAIVLSSPLIFLGAIMLTEPETTPATTRKQALYGALVGIILMSHWHIGTVYATPEVSLLIGNVFSFLVTRSRTLRLTLSKVIQHAPRITEYVFVSPHTIDYTPGQYAFWTLPHSKPDRRGDRRTFSLASVPGNNTVSFAVKTYEPSSRFKQTLSSMRPGDSITASAFGGSFTLPKDTNQPVVLIAGGVGVTPFLSMIRTMTARKQNRKVILFYLVSSAEEYCFVDDWKAATEWGLTVIPISSGPTPTSWKGMTGPLSKEILVSEVGQLSSQTFYLSGPPPFVSAYVKLLKEMGISRSRIKTDYFSGY